MCHYITGTFESSKIGIEHINAIGKDFGLQFVDCKNDFIHAQLDSKEHYIAKVSKYCDCGTPLGSWNKEHVKSIQRAQRSQEAEIEKLKKKGWSAAKIERFLTNRDKNNEKRGLSSQQQYEKATEDIQQWVNFINQLLSKTSIETFGLLLHFYSGSIENERIKISRKQVAFNDLLDKILIEMDEDTLYLIQKIK